MNKPAIRSRNADSESGPAVESRLYTAHSTRSASGAAAARGPPARPATSGPRPPAPGAARPRPRARRGPATASRSTWSPGGSGRRSGRAPSSSPASSARRRGRPDEAAEVPRPVQANQDLAQQAREADRLAAQLEDVDRRVDHGPRGLVGRERRRRPPGPAARTADPRARRPDRPPRPGIGDKATFARVRGPPGTAPEPGGTSSTTPPVSRPASGSRAAASRKSGRRPRPARRRRGTRGRRPRAGAPPGALRARIGSTPRRARVTAAACHDQDGRTAGPNSGSSGSVAAASRPSTHAVPW